MALVTAVAQTVLATVKVYHPDSMTLLEPLTLGLLAGVGVLWGAVDTWYRRVDRGIVWLKASILAGLLSGLLGVIGQAAFVDQTGISALGPALSGGAAFTALLVLIPAGLGLLLGNLLEPRVSTKGAEKKAEKGTAKAPGSPRAEAPPRGPALNHATKPGSHHGDDRPIPPPTPQPTAKNSPAPPARS